MTSEAGTTLVIELTELDDKRIDVAGGKGASLGELSRAGVRVPPGFVVARAAFDDFLAAADPKGEIGALIDGLDAGRLEAGGVASQIRELVGEAPVPRQIVDVIGNAIRKLDVHRVSVRSSATCEDSATSAWAGQLDTYLDVDPEQVVNRVRACWLSIFGERALAYGAEHGYGAGEFGVAVVVQAMVSSDVSGIGFSVHPVTQEPNLMLIEACLGLGEAIVSGSIRPDQYVVRRPDDEIVEQSVGEQTKGLFPEPGSDAPVWRELGPAGAKRKLSDDQVHSYADTLGRIERHYGHPVDTEWAIQDGSCYVLQARPITTLAPEYREAIVDDREPWVASVRRPLPLLECSVWGRGMAVSALDVPSDGALAIQGRDGVANLCLPKRFFDQSASRIRELVHDDREHLRALLRRGEELYQEGSARLKQGPSAFSGLREAGEFLTQAAEYTRTVPFLALKALDDEGVEDEEARALAESLRARTIYPHLARETLEPLAEQAAREVGFSAPERVREVALWPPLCDGTVDVAELEERLARVDAGDLFVYQSLPEGERVNLVTETGYLVMRIVGRHQIAPPDDPDVIAGQTAWPGVHKGRARVIVDFEAGEDQPFEEGDVVVSIQSSPALMPLLRRAGAIVTDEGGLACHAAIICRELQIPTIIGTGRATSAIHSGDLIEVDANQHVVRIIERA